MFPVQQRWAKNARSRPRLIAVEIQTSFHTFKVHVLSHNSDFIAKKSFRKFFVLGQFISYIFVVIGTQVLQFTYWCFVLNTEARKRQDMFPTLPILHWYEANRLPFWMLQLWSKTQVIRFEQLWSATPCFIRPSPKGRPLQECP